MYVLTSYVRTYMYISSYIQLVYTYITEFFDVILYVYTLILKYCCLVKVCTCMCTYLHMHMM